MAIGTHRRIILALAFLAAGTAARAQTTIQVPANGALAFCFAASPGLAQPRYCGQSFTVPTSNTVLESFTFFGVSNQGQVPVTFEILAISGNTLMGDPLFTAMLTTTGEGGLDREPRTFVPPGGLPLVGGATYAAVMYSVDEAGVGFEANDTNAYTGGSILLCNPDRVCNLTLRDSPQRFDDAFRAVFGPAVVPEPQTLALLGTGLLALGAMAARGRARGR